MSKGGESGSLWIDGGDEEPAAVQGEWAGHDRGKPEEPERYTLKDDIESFGVYFASRCMAKSLMSPIERVRNVMQCRGELERQMRIPTSQFTMWRYTSGTIQREGLFSMWRGNGVACGAVLPTALIQSLVGVPLSTKLFDAMPEDTNPFTATVAFHTFNLVSASLVTLMLYPLDLIQFRLQCDATSIFQRDGNPMPAPEAGKEAAKGAQPKSTYLYKNARDFCRTTYETKDQQRAGVFHRGVSTYLAYMWLYRLSFISMHTALSFTLLFGQPLAEGATPEEVRAYTMVNALITCASSATATLWLYPMDTIRKRMMLGVNSSKQYDTVLHCYEHIMRVEGHRALFHGLGLTMSRQVIAALGTYFVGISFYSM